MVLQLNGGNSLSVSAAGSFTFSATLSSGTAYAVTVSTQPTNQLCTVSSGSGTIAGANNVSVASGGTSFAFTGRLLGGQTYAVTISTQPSGQTCTLGNASGTIAAANVSNVTVTCLSNYTVGGTISGLTANGLKLTLLNATTGAQIDELTVASGSASFTFATTPPLSDRVHHQY